MRDKHTQSRLTAQEHGDQIADELRWQEHGDQIADELRWQRQAEREASYEARHQDFLKAQAEHELSYQGFWRAQAEHEQAPALLDEFKTDKKTRQFADNADKRHTAANESRIQDALSHIPPDHRRADDIGKALHSLHWLSDYVDAGLEIWDQWSKWGDGYQGFKKLQARWQTFDNKAPRQATIATLFEIARQHGWKEPAANNKAKLKKPGDEFRLIDIAAWHGLRPPPRDWVAVDRVPARVVTGLYGDGGVGKTILLLQLAVCVVLGINWLGAKVPVGGPVLLMCCEDDADELWRRLDHIIDYYGTDFATLAARGFSITTFAGEDATLALTGDKGMIEESQLFLRLTATIAKLRPRMVGIDNLADVFAGNEIVRTQVRQFMTKLHGLALRFDNAMVMTAHPSLGGMSSGKGTSGSTGWNNAFRSRMYFHGQQKDDPDDDIDRDYRELEVMKANYTLNGEVVKLRWSNGVFAPDQERAEIDQNAIQRAAEEEFLTRLDEFEQQGRIVSYKPKSNNYAPHMFSLGMTNSKARKNKKEIFESAMERLFRQRRVRGMPYGKPSDGTTQLMRHDPNKGDQDVNVIEFPKPDKTPRRPPRK